MDTITRTFRALRLALRREPVRAWCYGVALAALGLAVYYRKIDADAAPFWVALLVAVLGGTEATRSMVTPVVKSEGRHRA